MVILPGRRTFDALCAILALAAAGCGWFEGEPPGGFAETQAKIQNTKEALEALGAVIEDKQFPMNQSGYRVDLSGKEITDEMLTLLGRLTGVGEVDLSGSTITDEQMQRLGSVSPLWILDISNTSISDKGMSHLKQNTLARLDVRDTKVTDEWVQSLKKRYREDPGVHPFFKNVTVIQ